MWRWPLEARPIGITDESDSFKKIDMATEVEIPVEPHVGGFGVKRKHDRHRGVDLYAPVGAKVFVVEKGKVVDIRPWTGAKANCDWWLDTDAVLIEGESGLVVYGEIEVEEGVEVGMDVREGKLLGRVKCVLKRDKGRPMSMLHIELRKPGFLRNIDKDWDDEIPDGIKDPTSFLTLTNEIIQTIAGEVQGTCDSLILKIEKYELGIGADELESLILDWEIERCPHCGWWMECHELVDDDGELVGCEQCR